jgi:hypothetical protein
MFDHDFAAFLGFKHSIDVAILSEFQFPCPMVWHIWHCWLGRW